MRKLSLYIKDQEIELNDQNLILFNYSFEELGNPAGVKNSYTQAIDIDGTPANDMVFGGIYRFDQKATGKGFNPLIRTPFQIISDTGELKEAGYMKLDSIKREKDSHIYSVTLYGELGNILYHLAYNDQGVKKSLADLIYIQDYPGELDFRISASAVKSAWERLKTIPEIPSSVFDCINFAPVYGGVPKSGTFDSKRGIVRKVMLPVPDDPSGYSDMGGDTIVTLPKDCSPDDVADYRSYLQRPILSIKALFYALRRECGKYGYTFNFDSCKSLPVGWWKNLWITLPSMQKETKKQPERTPVRMSWDSRYRSSNPILTGEVFSTIPATSKISGKAEINLRFLDHTGIGDQLEFSSGNMYSVNFIQMIGRSAEGNAVGGSPLYCLGYIPGRKDPFQLAIELGYLPEWPTGNYIALPNDTYTFYSMPTNPSAYTLDKTIEIELEGDLENVKDFAINCVGFHFYTSQGEAVQVGSTGLVALYDQGGDAYMNKYATIDVISDEFYYLSGGTTSFSTIRKSDLLDTKGSPLDYLMSYVKTFGMVLTCDSSSRSLTISRRKDWFRNKVIDISDRVDCSDRTIDPCSIKSKFYTFKSKGYGSTFEKEYQMSFGREYGRQSVDTGMSFDSTEKDVMAKVIFKNGITCLENSANFARYYEGNSPDLPTKFLPSPVMAGGATYRLWNNGNESKDFPLPVPYMNVGWFNPAIPGYDVEGSYKLQLNEDGKALDGSDILLSFCDFIIHPYAKLSDDTPSMFSLNNGKACWDLNINQTPLEMPVFARSFKVQQMGGVTLDFGVPAELFVPPVDYPESATIYSQCWKRYMEDRYSANSKVVRVKVNFTGIEVNEDLMRSFYWFGNSIWSLNKIINHSLTTEDLTECEFIKVQDMNNYLQ